MARRKRQRRGFGEHGGATYAVVTRGDRAGGYSSRREVQGVVQSAACSTVEWHGTAAPAVLVRESAKGEERAIYACVPKARKGFRRPAPGETCGCTASRVLAARILSRL